jgi:hypothetical protein
MKDDMVLMAIVFVVWAVLAVLYATVPMLSMPGFAVVWGAGAVIFLLLALLIWAATHRSGHGSEADPT